MAERKTHYDPFPSYDEEEYTERGYCGTYLDEDGENVTSIKEDVTCKKCKRLFARAEIEVKQAEESIRQYHEGMSKIYEANKIQ